MKYKNHYQGDIAIIGAGPVGIFTVFQAGLLGMKAILIDSLPILGGQLTALYPEKPIYDIPAFPTILAKDLITHLTEQMNPMHPTILLNSRAMECKDNNDGSKTLILEHEDKGKKDTIGVTCKAVMIAAGGGTFDHKKPPIADLAQYENTSVFYLVKNPKDFQGKRVVIAGGGDSAVDWAINLAGKAGAVVVVHRRAEFRAMPQSLAMMKRLIDAGKITLKFPYQPMDIIADTSQGAGQMKAVVVQDLDGGREEIPADILLCFYGFASSLGPLKNWGLDVTPRGQIKVAQGTMLTNLPHIYAVGDVAQYEGKYKLIMQGFADAAVACHHAYPLIKGEALHFEHSTTRGVKELA